MDDLTFMSLVGRNGTHSLTHSILINLFIKLELNNFLLPPLLSIVFVQECSVVLKEVFDEGRLGRSTFCPRNGEPGKEFVELSASKIEVGHFGLLRFKCFCFVNMLFLTISFCSHIDESW